MTSEPTKRGLKPALMVLSAVLVTGLGYVGWLWREQQAMDELVSPGLILINYTDHDVYASVHYSKFPEPGQGAAAGMGPHAGGGGVVCCVPIPTIWRPGIKMVVWYGTKDWQKENGQTMIVELPEYPGGNAGDLFLSVLPDDSIELISANFAPGHPRWTGKMAGFPNEVGTAGESK